MLTVDLLKEMFDVKEDKDLARIMGKSAAAISKWRSTGEVPAIVERQAASILSNGTKSTNINGDNHHIDIHHACDGGTPYDTSPSTGILLDIWNGWDEKKRRRLIVTAINMDNEEVI